LLILIQPLLPTRSRRQREELIKEIPWAVQRALSLNKKSAEREAIRQSVAELGGPPSPSPVACSTEAALAGITADAGGVHTLVAAAVAGLSNRDAHAAIQDWMRRTLRGRGAWREASPAIWAERRRFRREAGERRKPSDQSKPHHDVRGEDRHEQEATYL
jgi:hypothetical protein